MALIFLNSWINAIRDHPGFPKSDTLVATELAVGMERFEGGFEVSQAKLAAAAQTHPRTLANVLRRLEGAGFLVIKRGAGRGRFNTYTAASPVYPARLPSVSDSGQGAELTTEISIQEFAFSYSVAVEPLGPQGPPEGQAAVADRGSTEIHEFPPAELAKPSDTLAAAAAVAVACEPSEAHLDHTAAERPTETGDDPGVAGHDSQPSTAPDQDAPVEIATWLRGIQLPRDAEDRLWASVPSVADRLGQDASEILRLLPAGYIEMLAAFEKFDRLSDRDIREARALAETLKCRDRFGGT